MALIYRPERVLKPPPPVNEALEVRRQSLRSNKDIVAAETQAPATSKPSTTSNGPAGEEVPPTPSPRRSPEPSDDNDDISGAQPRDVTPEYSRSQVFSDGNDEREVSNQLLEEDAQEESRIAGYRSHGDEPFNFSGHVSPGPSRGNSPSRPSSASAPAGSQSGYSHTGTVGTDFRMGDMSPLSMLSDDECDEDGDITMSNVREDAKEAIDSQDDLDMSQGMGHMSLAEGQDRRDGSTSPDPLALNDSTKDVSRYSPKPDPTTLFDEDEQTLRGPSGGQSSIVYEIHDDEEKARSGGVPAAQFYGTAPQKKAVRTYQQAKSEKAKGKQRAAPDATSDDVEVQDGIAEPELLRSDQ